jgi:hypothetical protein
MVKLVGDMERSLRGMQSFSETRAGSILRELLRADEASVNLVE